MLVEVTQAEGVHVNMVPVQDVEAGEVLTMHLQTQPSHGLQMHPMSRFR